jgi:hypothetical protein
MFVYSIYLAKQAAAFSIFFNLSTALFEFRILFQGGGN